MTPAHLAAFARGYRIRLHDYGRPASGLLISSGCGTMMAVMDHAPALRWCLDIDDQPADARLDSFLIVASRACEPVAIAGWFSITPIAPLRSAVEAVPSRRAWHAYTPGVRWPVEINHPTLGSLLAGLQI